MSPLLLRVVSSENLCGVMQRVVFEGEGLSENRIPEDFHGLHIKLLFKKPNQNTVSLPALENGRVVWPEPENKPASRTYSIYDFNPVKKQITVDFVLHHMPGIASTFAQQAKPGDIAGFAGPGLMPLIQPQKNNYLFVGDLSAVPAISALMKALAPDTNCVTYIELEDLSTAEDLAAEYFADCIEKVHFVQQTHHEKGDLLNKVKALGIPHDSENWSITLAGEHTTVVSIRDYLRSAGLGKSSFYAVPYWRHTMDEETYHEERHEVMDN